MMLTEPLTGLAQARRPAAAQTAAADPSTAAGADTATADVEQINNARAKLDRQMTQITTRKVRAFPASRANGACSCLIRFPQHKPNVLLARLAMG